MKSWVKALIVIGAVAVIGVVVVLGYQAASAAQPQDGIPRDAVTADLEAAKIQRIDEIVSATGTVSFIDRYSLYPSTSAELETFGWKVGDTIEADQVIAMYDDDMLETLQDQLADAKLALSSAELNLRSISLPATETELLQAEGGISQAEGGINQAENGISQAENGVTQAESGVRQAEDGVIQAQKAYGDLNDQIDTQDLAISQIKRGLELAEDQLGKTQVLYNEGVVTKSELDGAQENVNQIKDQLDNAENQRTLTLKQFETAERGIETAEKAVEAAKKSYDTAVKTRDTAASSLGTSSAALELAQKQYDTLLNKQNDPKLAVQIEMQRLQIQQAQNSIERIQEEIDDFITEEIAEHSGTVLTVGYSAGEMASPARPLLVVAELGSENLVISADIPENEAGELEVNQSIIISGSSIPDKEYVGHISKIYPTVEMALIGMAQEPAVKIEITIDDEGAVVKAGNTVDVDITTNVTEDAVVVPLMSTLLSPEKENYVFVYNTETKQVERRVVELMAYADLYVQVKGVEVGELIVASPPTGLEDGDYLRPGTITE